PGGRFKPPNIPDRLDFIASSARRPASLNAAVIRSSSISTSAGLELRLMTAEPSILSCNTCFCPFIFTVTAPPPEEASTTVWLSFSCIWSCMWRACSSISCIFKGFTTYSTFPSSTFVAGIIALVSQVEHAAHFGVEHLLRLAHQWIAQGYRFNAIAYQNRRAGVRLLCRFARHNGHLLLGARRT